MGARCYRLRQRPERGAGLFAGQIPRSPVRAPGVGGELAPPVPQLGQHDGPIACREVVQRRDELGHGVVPQRCGVVSVEAVMAAGRDEGRIQHPGQVLVGHERVRADDRDPERDRHGAHCQPVGEPAHAVAPHQGTGHHRAGGQPQDRHRDVEAELGPAVGLLVETQAERRRAEDHRREHQQRRRADEEPPRPPNDAVGNQQQQPGKRDDGDELEVALAGVVAVRHADRRQRVRTAEQVDDLHDGEQREEAIHGEEHGEQLCRPAPRGGSGGDRVDPPVGRLGAGVEGHRRRESDRSTNPGGHAAGDRECAAGQGDRATDEPCRPQAEHASADRIVELDGLVEELVEAVPEHGVR